MDNEKNTNGQDWLDQILGTSNTPKELGADEMAVTAAGLARPDDAELERIIQQTMEEHWGDEPAPDANTPVQEPTKTEYIDPEDLEEPVAPKKSAKKEAGKKNAPKGKKGFFSTTLKDLKSESLWGLTHIISSVIWLLVILAIGISVGRLGWQCASDVLALGKTPKELIFTVYENDDLDSIADRLESEGMIKYPTLFKLFAKLTHKGDNILVGSVTFNAETIYDYNALVNALSYRKTTKAAVEVMIPEGYSCAQIFALLEEKGVCAAKELETYAANGDLDSYWFLSEVERGHKYCLEGFLFPDTYEFYVGDTPRRVLEKFLDNFNYRFTDRMIDKFVELNKNLGLNLTLREVVTMASIVEKEKAGHLEGYTIASVFYNRLTHASSYPYLNSDATLLYDVEYYTGKGITNEQRANSKYNTYTQKGLPAGPIANPGLSSLDAALSPETTNYYYFVYDKKAGQHLFSKTYAEHQKKVKDLGL